MACDLAEGENDPRVRVQAWMAEYGRAWREADEDAVAELFTETGVYRSAPWRAPHIGRAEIRRYWREEPALHEDLDLRFGTPVVDGRRAAVEWWAIIRQGDETITGPGCLVLRFDSEWRCEELREYWRDFAGLHSPPPGWGE
jgi:hypothetical protein